MGTPAAVKASVFIGTSVDGFIARLNDDLDFLPPGGEPHGYNEFIASVDAIVIGRKPKDQNQSKLKQFPKK
jgi:hypothetical protein